MTNSNYHILNYIYEYILTISVIFNYSNIKTEIGQREKFEDIYIYRIYMRKQEETKQRVKPSNCV